MHIDLGRCPTGQHRSAYSLCGFMGCCNLKPWAKRHKYRYRYEKGYYAEEDPHIRGDGRWFLEILCRQGKIYPVEGTTLAAEVKRKTLPTVNQLRYVEFDELDDLYLETRIVKFDIAYLDEIASVLQPRPLRFGRNGISIKE